MMEGSVNGNGQLYVIRDCLHPGDEWIITCAHGCKTACMIFPVWSEDDHGPTRGRSHVISDIVGDKQRNEDEETHYYFGLFHFVSSRTSEQRLIYEGWFGDPT